MEVVLTYEECESCGFNSRPVRSGNQPRSKYSLKEIQTACLGGGTTNGRGLPHFRFFFDISCFNIFTLVFKARNGVNRDTGDVFYVVFYTRKAMEQSECQLDKALQSYSELSTEIGKIIGYFAFF